MTKPVDDVTRTTIQVGILALLVFPLTSCSSQSVVTPVEPATRQATAPSAVLLPRIDVPQRLNRLPLVTSHDALPAGARAQLPAYDGEPIFVTLPAREQANLNAQDALRNVILPILRSIGFQGGQDALAMPPTEGIGLPAADLAGLLEAMTRTTANNSQPLRPLTQSMIGVLRG